MRPATAFGYNTAHLMYFPTMQIHFAFHLRSFNRLTRWLAADYHKYTFVWLCEKYSTQKCIYTLYPHCTSTYRGMPACAIWHPFSHHILYICRTQNISPPHIFSKSTSICDFPQFNLTVLPRPRDRVALCCMRSSAQVQVASPLHVRRMDIFLATRLQRW